VPPFVALSAPVAILGALIGTATPFTMSHIPYCLPSACAFSKAAIIAASLSKRGISWNETGGLITGGLGCVPSVAIAITTTKNSVAKKFHLFKQITRTNNSTLLFKYCFFCLGKKLILVFCSILTIIFVLNFKKYFA
jgi:hypothetical protein